MQSPMKTTMKIVTSTPGPAAPRGQVNRIHEDSGWRYYPNPHMYDQHAYSALAWPMIADVVMTIGAARHKRGLAYLFPLPRLQTRRVKGAGW